MNKKKNTEIFISTDVEADGRVPGLSNMLSFASAAYDINKTLLGTFSANLELLPEASPEPETMAFWNSTSTNKKAYEATRVDLMDPKTAFLEYADWLESLGGTPVFVGYPAVYDFKWIDYYSVRFTGNNPFGFSRCIDVKSYVWALLKTEKFAQCTKRNMPKHWFDKLPHTHVALDDAIEQGALFINIHREALGLSRLPDIEL